MSLLFLNKKKFLTTGIFLILIFFSWTGGSTAQTTSLSVTIEAREEPLSKIFGSITRQTGIRFSYNSQIIDDTRKISLKIQNGNLQETLKYILPSSINYKILNNHIILFIEKRAEKPIPEEKQLPSGSRNSVSGKETESSSQITEEDNTLISNESSFYGQKKSFSNNGFFKNDCLDSVVLKIEEQMKEYLAALLIGAAITIDTATAQLQTDRIPSETEEISNSELIYSENHIVDVESNVSDTGEATPIQIRKPVQATFVYPLGTDWVHSRNNVYSFSFNLIGGYTGGVRGAEIATVFNINRYNVYGVQLAGAFNMAGVGSYKEGSKNVQLAAGFNFTKNGQSTQLAGGANIADTGYFQAAAGINFAKLSKAQLAGGINITQDGIFQAGAGINVAKSSKAQLTGGVNLTKEGAFQASAGINVAENSAAQLTGGVNITRKGRFQMSAGVNVAKQSDCQIAGAVNVTKKGGFQLGIINVRDTADGVSLGILNIVAHGGILEAGIEGGEFLQTAITFRSGTQRLYTVLSAGGSYTNKFWTFGAGFGTGFRFTNWLGLNLELLHHGLYDIDLDDWNYKGLVQFRSVLNFRIANHFKMFAGPVFNLLIEEEPITSEYISHLSQIKVPYALFDEYVNNSARLRGWIGFSVGMKF